MTEEHVELARSINQLRDMCHENAKKHGFHDVEQNFGEKIALIHSELSEALEAHRTGRGPDEHVPTCSNLEIELADAVIRIMDLAGSKMINIGFAVMAKHEFNKGRLYRHGKKY